MTEPIKPLRCQCSHHDIVAKYDDTHVEIKGKHGCYTILEVVEGKLKPRNGISLNDGVVNIVK